MGGVDDKHEFPLIGKLIMHHNHLVEEAIKDEVRQEHLENIEKLAEKSSTRRALMEFATQNQPPEEEPPVTNEEMNNIILDMQDLPPEVRQAIEEGVHALLAKIDLMQNKDAEPAPKSEMMEKIAEENGWTCVQTTIDGRDELVGLPTVEDMQNSAAGRDELVNEIYRHKTDIQNMFEDEMNSIVGMISEKIDDIIDDVMTRTAIMTQAHLTRLDTLMVKLIKGDK